MHQSHFTDFQTEPIATIERLYARFKKPLTGDAREAMQKALDANPADRHGTHSYTRDSIGKDRAALRARFARYQDAFEVPSDD